MNIFEEIKKIKLPSNQYAVVGGGVMEAHGIREHGDIDIIVTEELYIDLQKKGWRKVSDKINVIQKGNCEADKNFHYGDYKPNQEALIKNAELINGVPFIRLEEVIKFKIALGRDKDKRDIELINNYLRNSVT